MSLQVVGGLCFAVCLSIFSLASLVMRLTGTSRVSETPRRSSFRQTLIDVLLPTTTLIISAVMIWSLISGRWQTLSRWHLGSAVLVLNLVVVKYSTQWNRSRK